MNVSKYNSMFSVTCFKISFTPKWIYVVLTLVFCSLFSTLGFWQLVRADEKKKMIAAHERQAMMPAVSLNKTQSALLQYQSVVLSGHFLSQNMLLDNQHHEHQFGYDVLTPMELEDGSVVIVDRGWVLADPGRSTFPEFQNSSDKLRIEGVVYYPSAHQWVLGDAIEAHRDDKTVLVESIDIKLLSQFLQKPLYPFIIRLSAKSTEGFVRAWRVVAMPPERHFAYAVQWFAFALITLILFVVLNSKKVNEYI